MASTVATVIYKELDPHFAALENHIQTTKAFGPHLESHPSNNSPAEVPSVHGDPALADIPHNDDRFSDTRYVDTDVVHNDMASDSDHGHNNGSSHVNVDKNFPHNNNNEYNNNLRYIDNERSDNNGGSDNNGYDNGGSDNDE